MNKKECDIIRDLLPSYVDNICSETSNEWIKEHLEKCTECRSVAEALKTTEFSAKQLDFAQVDAVKKVKKKQVGNSIVMLGLCLFLLLMTVAVFAEGNTIVSQMVLSAELPICMAITWFVNKGRQAKRTWDKWDTASLAAAVLATGYGIAVMFLIALKTVGGTPILGMELSEIGPFLAMQLMGTAAVCLGVYVMQMVRLYRTGSANSAPLHLCLMGIFLMLSYYVCMCDLTDAVTAIENIKKATFILLDIGLVGTAIFAFLDKKRKII